MADRLTQLQDCFDQLTVQMYSCLMYINTRAPYASIEGQPDFDPQKNDESKGPSSEAQDTQTQTQTQTATGSSNNNTQATSQQNADGQPEDLPADVPHSPEMFDASLQELACDLVIKEQQIEYLIDVLPGIGQSEKEQTARLQELEEQLKSIEAERLAAIEEKDRLVEKLDTVVAKVRRY